MVPLQPSSQSKLRYHWHHLKHCRSKTVGFVHFWWVSWFQSMTAPSFHQWFISMSLNLLLPLHRSNLYFGSRIVSRIGTSSLWMVWVIQASRLSKQSASILVFQVFEAVSSNRHLAFGWIPVQPQDFDLWSFCLMFFETFVYFDWTWFPFSQVHRDFLEFLFANGV